jgi:hypothetical protein
VHSANAGGRVNFTHDLRMSLRGAIIAFIRRGINDNARRLPLLDRQAAERKSAGEKKPVQRKPDGLLFKYSGFCCLYTAWMLDACLPFGPWVTSKETF